MTRSLRIRDLPLDLSTPDGRARLAELQAGVIRLRNFGANIPTIADRLGLSERDAEALLTQGLRELATEDAQSIVGRQQATLNDMRRALYPGLASGDTAAMRTLLAVLDHESKLHGTYAPQRVRVGLDAEEFAVTAAEDLRALGVNPQALPVPLDDVDEPWANT